MRCRTHSTTTFSYSILAVLFTMKVERYGDRRDELKSKKCEVKAHAMSRRTLVKGSRAVFAANVGSWKHG
ncbi:MAG: hypothetical protein IPP83_18455 [Flavobacteriales bacterium]|nr:hypothetical protein [Flavobacteriales bacterium]